MEVAFLLAPVRASAYTGAMSTPLILHYAPDNASLIIRLALEELGLAFETRLVDRGQTAQRSPAYLALNPAGRIPTLETPDGPISEVAAILLWLSETTGRMAPAPGTPERGRFLNTLFFVSNTAHAELAQFFYLHRYGPEESLPEMAPHWTKRLHRHFAILEAVAAEGNGWIGAAPPSILDPYLCALCRWAQLYPTGAARWFDLSGYPALDALCHAWEDRASVAALSAAEGLGARPLTAPEPPDPPEGRAT